jgi:predicted nucleic acid-binding protein
MAAGTRRPIGRAAAFWDASALVPLCVRQAVTPRAIALYRNYEPVVWWATPVEIASALARLARMNQLDPTAWAKARNLAEALASSSFVVLPSDALRSRAIDLVDHYDLRAADSLQLAAALEWCEDMPLGKVFLTGDQKLKEAALFTGFDANQF